MMLFGAPRKLMEMEVMYQENGELVVTDVQDSLKVHRYVKHWGTSCLCLRIVLLLRVKQRL